MKHQLVKDVFCQDRQDVSGLSSRAALDSEKEGTGVEEKSES